ncbi:PAS domain S-box-containing protein [Maribacter aquivivus]|uniref:histidine kinase n=1 Tax=Maribacter aquivivus TaxID=228958 RepID=A0A1M6M444_9FLAO|nr:PAS domain-containing protein [Maribacter aquivivus]SHJ78229.1 PAS domain S-box-containing protein [Maribacter aquivivus]
MSTENTLLQTDKTSTTPSSIKNIGIFQFEVDSNKVTWNDVLREIHQVPKTFIPNADNIYGNCKEGIVKENLIKAHTQALLKGVSFELEYEVITPKGSSRFLHVATHATTNDNKCTSLHGFITDITHTKVKNIENHILKKQLEYAEKLANSGSWKWDINLDTLTWSDNFYHILKRHKEKPLSFETFLEYVHIEDKEEIAAKFDLALKTKHFPDSNYRIALKDGTIKNMKSIGEVITDAHGEVITIMGTCQDITESKERDQQLIQKKQQLELTENSSEAGTWQLNTKTGAFKWSDNLYKITDFEYGEPISFEVLYARIHPKDKPHVDKALQSVKNTGIKKTFSHRLITRDKSIRTLEITADVVSNRINNDKVLIGTARDITDRIKIEHELIEKNQLLNFAEHLTTMGYWRYKPETDDVFWSDNLYQMFEQPKTDKLSFSTYFNKIHSDDKAFVKEKIDQSIIDHKFYDFTHRIVLSDNTIRFIQILGKVTINRNDGSQELLGTCLDVTDNESRELELSKKNQQLNVAEKMAMIGYWQWNTTTNEVFWSDNLHAIYGHDKREPLTFETYINYIHKEDKKTVVANLETAMKTGEFLESTYRIQLDDGSIKIIKSVGKITLNSKGEVLEMSGTCQDITENKKKELELLEINRQLNLAEQMAMLGMWVWKPSKNIFKWSDSLYKIYGFELGSDVNIDKAISMIYTPDKEKVKEVIKNLLNGIEVPRSTYRIIVNNNEIKTLEVRREISKDEHGNIELLGTTQDITHIVETEQLLQEKNHLLSFTEEMASMGSWQWNPHTGISKWSDNLYKLYDLELGVPIDMDLFLSRIHPEDSEKVVEHIEHIVATQKSESLLSYRIVLNDDSIRSLELMAEVVKDSNGQMIELIGTAQDVTDRIKREQDLIEKNQLLTFAEQLSSIGYWKWDIIQDVMEKSENLLKILDFEPGAKPDFKTYLKRVHPADREKVIDISQRIIETKKFDKFHHRIVKNDNSIKTIKLIGEVILDKEGNVIELIGSSQDITEQIEAHQKIMDTNRSLEKSTINLTSKNKQLAEFNHITSHNLRSPVSNLNALLGLYKSTENESKKIEIFEKFEIVIDHLTETLNALIETISIKNSAVEITQELCFEQTLLKTKEILAAELIKSNANIRCDFSKAQNVRYNPIYLESIFLNLVSNSLKYRSEDRVPEISITSNTVNGRITLEFEDNGLGIDMKSNGHKLFGLNKVFHKHPDAKGIGLFLTKAQIVAMGGSISAKSKVDVGTTFFIILN